MEVQKFKAIAACLLARHYGVEIDETSLREQRVCESMMRAGARPYEVVNAHANDIGLFRVDVRGDFGMPTRACLTAEHESSAGKLLGLAEESNMAMRAIVNDEYAGSIIGGHEELYNAFEIRGVRNLNHPGDPAGTHYVVDHKSPDMYSVFARLKDGGCDAVGDFTDYERARGYAARLSADYRWPVYDAVAAKPPTLM